MVCPHCGQASGVERDPVAVAEADLLLESERIEPKPDLELILRDHRLPKPAAPAETETDDDFPRAIVVKRD